MDESHHADFNLSTFTLECWVTSDDKTDYHFIIDKEIDNYTDRNFALYSNITTGAPVAQFRNSGNANETITGTTDLTSAGWHYVVAVNNGSYLSLYVNKTAEGTPDAVASNPATQAAPLMIGRENSSATPRYWNGKLDEIRISNTARNTSWINTTYNTISNFSSFLTFGLQKAKNAAPAQSSPSPAAGATGQSLNPQLSITVNDSNSDLMNVTFYTNVTGSWGLIGYNASSANGTYYQTNSSMSSYNTKYYWSVNVSDNTTWTNTTYNFTTSALPQLSSPNPADGATDVSLYPACNVTVSDTDGGTVDVYFYENTTGGWILQQTNDSVDVTSSANVSWGNYTNASSASTKYWWSVNVTDSYGWTNATYSFTTAASPFIYTYHNNKYVKLSDFIPDATTSYKEYTHFIDITHKSDVINDKIKLKITEELEETTYLDRIYLRIDGHREIELKNLIATNKKPIMKNVYSSHIHKNLLRNSDNSYLVMRTGDEYLLEFMVSPNYDKIEFAAEGYYIEHNE
jgi:hypothetical protein